MVCAFGVLQAGAGVKGASATSLKPIDRAAECRGYDSEGADGSGRDGSFAHPAGRVHRQLRNDRARWGDPSACRHVLQDRLEHQDDDICRDYAAGPGRKNRLDDPVSKYVPGVPNGDDITIAELLKMRSGLYNYTDAPELAASLDHDPTKAWTPAEVLAIAFKHPPLFPPGQAYDYCNTNYALLGLIAETVEAKPLAGLLQTRLFGPLGIRDTHCSRLVPPPRCPNPTRMATSMAVPPTLWRICPIPPSFGRRPRQEH